MILFQQTQLKSCDAYLTALKVMVKQCKHDTISKTSSEIESVRYCRKHSYKDRTFGGADDKQKVTAKISMKKKGDRTEQGNCRCCERNHMRGRANSLLSHKFVNRMKKRIILRTSASLSQRGRPMQRRR